MKTFNVILVFFLDITRFFKNNTGSSIDNVITNIDIGFTDRVIKDTGLSDHTAQWISVARCPTFPHRYVYVKGTLARRTSILNICLHTKGSYYCNEIKEPLTFVINHSLMTGVLPDKLKFLSDKPLFKRTDCKEISNYRPVTQLYIFSKVCERVVLWQR